MNNMQKSFKKKSALRCMADGGIFKSMQRVGQDDIAVFTDAKNKVAGAQPYTPMAMRDLPNAGITSGGVTTPLPAGAAPAPVPVIQPAMPAPAKLSVKPTAPIAPVAPAAPVPAPAAPQQFKPQDPYEKITGKPQIPIGPRSNYMAATGGFGPTPMPAPPPQRQPRAIGSMRQDIGAMGMPLMTSVGYAAGGPVRGPGGPTDDEVGPVMLSDGEYVLPADTVRKVGKENLDALKDATHTPVKKRQGSPLRKMADGTKTEKEKRLGALGLPITTSVEYVEPTRATPEVGALRMPITTSTGPRASTPTPPVGALGLPITTSVEGPAPPLPERTGALRMPITTSAGYGKPAAQPPPESAVGWQGKPRATPPAAPAAPEVPKGILERLGAGLEKAAPIFGGAANRVADEKGGGMIARGVRGMRQGVLTGAAGVEAFARNVVAPVANEIGVGLGFTDADAPKAPSEAAPGALTPEQQKQLDIANKGVSASEELYRAGGKDTGGTGPDHASPSTEPLTGTGEGVPEYTPFQQAELDKMQVGGAYLDAPIDVQRSPLRNDPYQPAAIPSGATQINSKFYRDASGAVLEGKAPGPTTPAPLAGPTPDSAPVDADLPLAQGPRAFRSDTIREGTTPGEFANLGNRIFGTSSKEGGRMDTFVGVGTGFNERSAEFGPDPGGLDRARQDAAVEKMYPTKPKTPRSFQPQFQSNARQINSQYDKMDKDLRGMFSSPKAQGNLAKALERSAAARMQALGQDTENITRQQQAAMQAQQQSQQMDFSARELASREQQAARADETDRLAITSQDQRAAATAAQSAASDALKQETTEWKTMVTKGQFYGDLADWRAYKVSGSDGKSYRANKKEVMANEKRVTDLAGKMFPDEPEKAQAVSANSALLYGSPDSAVPAFGNAIADLVAITGRTKLGVPVQAEDGKYTYKVSLDDLQKGTFGVGNSIKTLLYGWSGEAYKFQDASGEEYYVPKIRAYPETDRFIEGYFKARKDADKGSK